MKKARTIYFSIFIILSATSTSPGAVNCSAYYTDTIASLMRGPYIQIGSGSSVILRWKTNVPTTSYVTWGTNLLSQNFQTIDTNQVMDHIINISGLTPSTKYFYTIGSSIQTLQGDNTNFFVSPPTSGSTDTVRIWAIGDCGNNSTNQKNVRDRYYSYMNGRYTNVWLLMGDNAYTYGLDSEYQAKFFDVYKDKILKQTLLCPAPGNHDYAGNATLQVNHNIPYYNIFSLPANGEMGGIPSHTEAFYSYDYGNIHFISLDSYGKDSAVFRLSDTLGPQARWLKQDLANNTQKWTIIYWHHPPYTMGSHNSDTESELINIRQKLLPLIERYKVDLVLSGHSHDYERTRLIKGHYGNEASFDPMIYNIDSSSALFNGTSNSCPYIKGETINPGVVYAVVGSAGQVGGTQASFPHSAMYYSNATRGGGLAIEVVNNRLTAKWVCNDGIIRDQFSILKNVNQQIDTTITYGDSISLCASWPGNYFWNHSAATSKCITVRPDSATSYIVHDVYNCLADTFNVAICYPPSIVFQDTNRTICEGNNTQFSITATGSGILSYSWESSNDSGLTWTSVTDTTIYSGFYTNNLTINASTAINNFMFRCKTTNSCGNIISTPLTLNVLPVETPAINLSISYGSNPSCENDSIGLYALTISEGTTPSYNWYLNNVLQVLDSNYYESSSFQSGDSIYCILQSSMFCASPGFATSDTIIIERQAYITPQTTISIDPAIGPYCQDSPITFYAHNYNEGSNPLFNWLINGQSIGITNDSSITSSTLMNSDTVTVILSSNASCLTNITDTSNAVIVSITPTIYPTIMITATPNDTVNFGDTIRINAVVTGQGNAPHYQWYLNGFISGGDTNLLSIINFNDGDSVYCVLYSNENCLGSNGIQSNTIHVGMNNITGLNVKETKNDVKIYPIPFREHIDISWTHNDRVGTVITLYNSIGEVLIEENIQNSQQLSINTSSLSSGSYLIKVVTNENYYIQKLIKD